MRASSPYFNDIYILAYINTASVSHTRAVAIFFYIISTKSTSNCKKGI